jgi:hypothetical protein
MARLREASRAQRGRIMTEDGDGDVWVAGTCLAVSQTCPRQIHRLLSHLYDRWRLAFASEMLKCDKGDQVQTLGIVVSHRLLQDLNKGLSLAVSTHAAPVAWGLTTMVSSKAVFQAGGSFSYVGPTMQTDSTISGYLDARRRAVMLPRAFPRTWADPIPSPC